MTARPTQRLRRSAVQLTSMMDLLFVLLFAFMLKTSGDVELLAKEATAEVFEELDRVNQEVRQLLFVKDENISLAQQLSLAEQKIKDLEQSEIMSAARIAELEQVKATDVAQKMQAPRAGRWEMTPDDVDIYYKAEGEFRYFWVLTKVSEQSRDDRNTRTIKYSIREEMRGKFGSIYESMTGEYDPESNLFTIKTLGFTHADGGYEVERLYDPLGYVRLLNSEAQARGWAVMTSDDMAVVTANGRKMRGEEGGNVDPEKGKTDPPWTAVWLSP